MAVNLPQEIIDEILSYGDVAVTQRYKSVIIQINYHIKMLAVDSRAMPPGLICIVVFPQKSSIYIFLIRHILKNVYIVMLANSFAQDTL